MLAPTRQASAGSDDAKRRQHPRPPLAMFAVKVEAHELEGGRYLIPASRVRLPAANETHARLLAVRMAHAAAGLPCWRPLVRESMTHATGRAA
jgi:hypothetical protein